MSAYRGHGRSTLFTGKHLTNNVQAANYKRGMMLFSMGPCQTTVRFMRRRIVCTGLSLPNTEQRTRRFYYYFFAGGPHLCPCEVKTSISFINNFHFSCANVNVAGWGGGGGGGGMFVESSAFIKQWITEESGERLGEKIWRAAPATFSWVLASVPSANSMEIWRGFVCSSPPTTPGSTLYGIYMVYKSNFIKSEDAFTPLLWLKPTILPNPFHVQSH